MKKTKNTVCFYKKQRIGAGVFRLINKKGQSILEYALLTAAVAAAFVTMQQFILRATQARLKLIEDQINQPVVVVNP